MSKLRRILRVTNDADAQGVDIDRIRALRLEGRRAEADALMKKYRAACCAVREYEAYPTHLDRYAELKRFNAANGYCTLCNMRASEGRKLCQRHLDLKRLLNKTPREIARRKRWWALRKESLRQRRAKAKKKEQERDA